MNPIRKRIAIQNGFRNVIRSFVNMPSGRKRNSTNNWLGKIPSSKMYANLARQLGMQGCEKIFQHPSYFTIRQGRYNWLGKIPSSKMYASLARQLGMQGCEKIFQHPSYFTIRQGRYNWLGKIPSSKVYANLARQLGMQGCEKIFQHPSYFTIRQGRYNWLGMQGCVAAYYALSVLLIKFPHALAFIHMYKHF